MIAIEGRITPITAAYQAEVMQAAVICGAGKLSAHLLGAVNLGLHTFLGLSPEEIQIKARENTTAYQRIRQANSSLR